MKGSMPPGRIWLYCCLTIALIVHGIPAEYQGDESGPPIPDPSFPIPPDIQSDPGIIIPDQPDPGTIIPNQSEQVPPEPVPAEPIPADLSSDELSFNNPYEQSAILVQFNPKSAPSSLQIHSRIQARVIHDYSSDGIPGLELVALPDRLSPLEAVSYYQKQPGVMYAEPDYYRFSDRTPSDSDFWRQWGLLNTGQTYREDAAPGLTDADNKVSQAWDTTTGSASIIAVIDSGIDYLHPDLQANIWIDPNTSTSGYDAITGDLEPMDTASHGTHCAGIIGAVGDDGSGITGVNWRALMMPVRFLNSFGVGRVSDEIESILWATRNGARIISCSYGGRTFSRAEYEVMRSSDALFICAAGNSQVNTDKQPYYPASLNLTGIISVAATDATDNLSEFSNYGRTSVDIAAPGVEIYSTMHNIYQPVPVWTDPLDSLQNWTLQGNWTLDDTLYRTPNSSARGYTDRIATNSSQPDILTLKSPLDMNGIMNPVLSYQWSMNGTNYSFMIEGSANGVSWIPLDFGKGTDINLSFMKRECKIPLDLRNGSLYIRFVADGEVCTTGLDDISLSDGYGDLNETRWGYMNGTSMASSQVSGAVGLLASANPDATLGDIARQILKTADPLPSLSGRTVTGGRLNLTAAMNTITGGSAYHLRLKNGWNHVSLPYRLVEGNDTAGDIFGSLTNVSGHSLYRVYGDTWITVLPDERILPLVSYWVYTGIPASVPVMVDPNQSGSYAVNLTTGWSGIGIVGEEEIQARDALSSLSDIWSLVIGFNATTQISEEPIIRGGSGLQNDSRMLQPFQGYWIYMTRNGTYEKKEMIPVEETPGPVWPQPLR